MCPPAWGDFTLLFTELGVRRLSWRARAGSCLVDRLEVGRSCAGARSILLVEAVHRLGMRPCDAGFLLPDTSVSPLTDMRCHLCSLPPSRLNRNSLALHTCSVQHDDLQLTTAGECVVPLARGTLSGCSDSAEQSRSERFRSKEATPAAGRQDFALAARVPLEGARRQSARVASRDLGAQRSRREDARSRRWRSVVAHR